MTYKTFSRSDDHAIKIVKCGRNEKNSNINGSLSNTSVAEIISVDFPAWAAIHSNGSLPDDSVWLKAADPLKIVENGASNVSLANLTIRGDSPGSTNISVTIN